MEKADREGIGFGLRTDNSSQFRGLFDYIKAVNAGKLW